MGIIKAARGFKYNKPVFHGFKKWKSEEATIQLLKQDKSNFSPGSHDKL